MKNKDILLKDIEEINLNENNKIEKNKKSKEKNLYFECVKYNYILYLQDETKSILDCINYSRKYFKPFIFDKNYINEISKLMVKLL